MSGLWPPCGWWMKHTNTHGLMGFSNKFISFWCKLGTASRGWSSPSTGWTGQNWTVLVWCVNSRNQRRSCSCWMWRMLSCMLTSWCWAFSSWPSDWPLIWSSATRSSPSVRMSFLGWIWTLIHISAVWVSNHIVSFSVSLLHIHVQRQYIYTQN